MAKNIDKIVMWEKNPDKSRTSNIARIDFKFPCIWTTLSLEDLKQLLREWIKGEELRYPIEKGYRGRWLLYDEITKVFNEPPAKRV